jgi:predicted DNA-binding transcriptional regulator AlpA
MSRLQELENPELVSGAKRRRSGPRAPLISLDQPGRLRAMHVCAVLSVSRATLYVRMRSGLYPKPDGYEGRFPYWKTSTIRAFVIA